MRHDEADPAHDTGDRHRGARHERGGDDEREAQAGDVLAERRGLLVGERQEVDPVAKEQERDAPRHDERGGPKDVAMLFDLAHLAEDFGPDIRSVHSFEGDIDLDEGRGHIGRSAIVRFVGVRI